ncbi:MAG: hypothetical protein DRQ55_16520 [Planctomycetota bacterium]|nr:MAG: hypothetical protein DRQ55_16520 [Planctomycetota bacterium]RLA43822.1 MAG: hypothetical protein DRQ97_12270 [Gammaproteobacteria bacterium]
MTRAGPQVDARRRRRRLFDDLAEGSAACRELVAARMVCLKSFSSEDSAGPCAGCPIRAACVRYDQWQPLQLPAGAERPRHTSYYHAARRRRLERAAVASTEESS